VNAPTATLPTFVYTVRLADDLLINAQRLGEYITHAPELEEELAIANTALDNLGVAQQLYEYAAKTADDGRSADDLAFLRSEREFCNALLVEQPHQDFADVMVRQFLLDAFHVELWPGLTTSTDVALAAIAAKADKEARYHFRHSARWVVRLGDGTAESSQRAQRALDTMWRFSGELVTPDATDAAAASAGLAPDLVELAAKWRRRVEGVIAEATLEVPADPFQATGGRSGNHTEHLGHLLAEMQFMQRAYPGMTW